MTFIFGKLKNSSKIITDKKYVVRETLEEFCLPGYNAVESA
jgi:hypothetical protein